MFPFSRPLGTYSKNNKKFFHPRDMKFSKNLSCFTSHPKYNGLLGEILFSSFLTCSIISFHLFIITSNDQKYEFESNELFSDHLQRSLLETSFRDRIKILICIQPRVRNQRIFQSPTEFMVFFPRFHIQHEEIFLNHTHYKDAQIIKIKILVLIHLI